MEFITYGNKMYDTTRIFRGKKWKYIIIDFFYYMWSAVTPIEVEYDKFKMHVPDLSNRWSKIVAKYLRNSENAKKCSAKKTTKKHKTKKHDGIQ